MRSPAEGCRPTDRLSQRLDVQHRAFKAMQGGKNYWAPIDEVLKAAGEVDEEKRLLDVGTGESAIDFALCRRIRGLIAQVTVSGGSCSHGWRAGWRSRNFLDKRTGLSRLRPNFPMSRSS